MKPQKNKIVFAMVLAGVILFIAVYSILTFGKDKKAELKPDRIPMPDLEENQEVYESKMEALDAHRHPTHPNIIRPTKYVDDVFHNRDEMLYFEECISPMTLQHNLEEDFLHHWNHAIAVLNHIIHRREEY